MRVILLAAAAALITGCAAQQPLVWDRVWPGDADLSQDLARCDYESTAATQATDYSFRSGLGQELDRAIRKRDLGMLCMKSKGWAAR